MYLIIDIISSAGPRPVNWEENSGISAKGKVINQISTSAIHKGLCYSMHLPGPLTKT
jgi:hypothetical protein